MLKERLIRTGRLSDHFYVVSGTKECVGFSCNLVYEFKKKSWKSESFTKSGSVIIILKDVNKVFCIFFFFCNFENVQHTRCRRNIITCFLVNDQRDAQIPFYVFILFTALYMFRAHRAHHQEGQIVSIQPLVTVTLRWWLCLVHTTQPPTQ